MGGLKSLLTPFLVVTSWILIQIIPDKVGTLTKHPNNNMLRKYHSQFIPTMKTILHDEVLDVKLAAIVKLPAYGQIYRWKIITLFL